MRRMKIAVVQMRMHPDHERNIEQAEARVREAARQGANLVLLPELFAQPYFCKDQDARFFDWALPASAHPVIERFRAVARELGLVLPVSFFERSGPTHFNSLAMIDADGSVRGIYRKAHIP
ncbi:MAG: nitrilase-related carbon-nitrogen hydrolase, partial [Gammaproteobacteria bacterium]